MSIIANAMCSSLTDAEVRIRKFVASKAAIDQLYAFDLDECQDASLLERGTLLEQNEDFWMFETNIARVMRAGPGQNSPSRVLGELDVTLMTKSARDRVTFEEMVEVVAGWFTNKTIDGIRFRTFVPVRATPLHGFTAYGGTINYQFEIAIATE